MSRKVSAAGGATSCAMGVEGCRRAMLGLADAICAANAAAEGT
eukprot:CAMPEP_0177782358 /NCGR_PEP_ID=MMETSP0491_2-20121128/18416_1 /TAXON_ID=63592 /ORGANISM="Tetraselmis chuii, Strain PLY429" /LENGTH=42 /DNA_ID= /DNA_START= /DNA_END= /DNA_ORIENTATION=